MKYKKLYSDTGYSCPNCGAICGKHTKIRMTDISEMNGTHFWEEKHKCSMCETKYWIKNSDK